MRKLVELNTHLLNDLVFHLKLVDGELYQKPIKGLSNSSIGQHIRHVLEFYQAIDQAMPSKNLCYDDRSREVSLEKNLQKALDMLNSITAKLQSYQADQEIKLTANYSESESDPISMKSSLKRELAFAMDHTIHHLAIIKNTLIENEIPLKESFGIAPSTIRYKSKTCVQ